MVVVSGGGSGGGESTTGTSGGCQRGNGAISGNSGVTRI